MDSWNITFKKNHYKMFLNIEAFICTAGSRCLCPLTSPLSKNLVEKMFSSPTNESNPWLSTDKGQGKHWCDWDASAFNCWIYSQIPELPESFNINPRPLPWQATTTTQLHYMGKKGFCQCLCFFSIWTSKILIIETLPASITLLEGGLNTIHDTKVSNELQNKDIGFQKRKTPSIACQYWQLK